MHDIRKEEGLLCSPHFSPLPFALAQYPEAPRNSPVKLNSALWVQTVQKD